MDNNKEFSEEQLNHVKKAIKGWESVTFDQIKVTNGWGLCNYTYIVRAQDPQVNPPAVFYRKFLNHFSVRRTSVDVILLVNLTMKKIKKGFEWNSRHFKEKKKLN